jgi:hypothetical protein
VAVAAVAVAAVVSAAVAVVLAVVAAVSVEIAIVPRGTLVGKPRWLCKKAWAYVHAFFVCGMYTVVFDFML